MRPPIRPRAMTACLLLTLAVVCAPASVLAAGAEIVMLQGQGERSEGPSREAWHAAAEGDVVQGGFWVRTLANSQMGLVVPARNQIRLNQNSEMQLKTEAESRDFAAARVQLTKGRAWSQARPRPARGGAAKQPALAMETPSATLSIRGTDWEVEVAEDGTTQVVVLSGVVDVGNEHGQLSVGQGEAALAEPGKAPVKRVLINPESRVQWVSSWLPQPDRWLGPDAAGYAAALQLVAAGDYAAALAAVEPHAARDAGAALIAADLLIQRGDIEQAVAVLAAHARDGNGDPRAAALLARADARLDRLDQAAQLLAVATAAHPGHIELLLARGEIAILSGDAALASQLFDDAVARAPDNAEAWYGLGLIAAERENVRVARSELQRALERDPELGRARAELAAVETFAGNLETAEAAFDALLASDASNYVALTGRGINRLKRGDADAALEDFLKAGLIEPRYARAWLYSGVAFYQLGETDRALQAFRHAAALDTRDPIPDMMVSQTQGDALDFGAAMASARRAQQNMPYLRSLNQLANDQKGSANLGSPIAKFGLEEWAKYYADEAYSPYWGGSHLFLADRYTGLFAKNSELMKGFLTDPLAFGASNRASSLVRKPGHYGRVDAEYLRDDWNQGSLVGTANGLVEGPATAAYFVRGEMQSGDNRKDDIDYDFGRLTAGLGLKPTAGLGLFAFGVDNEELGDFHTKRFPDGNSKHTEQRGDFGLSYKWAPENQFWLKIGDGEQSNRVTGELFDRATARRLSELLLHVDVSPNAALNLNETRIEADDVQLRHSFSVGETLWSWGFEDARQTQTQTTINTYRPYRFDTAEDFSVDDQQAYLSLRFPLPAAFTVEAGLYYQDSQASRDYSSLLQIPGRDLEFVLSDADSRAHSTNINPRLGLKWAFAPAQALRLVGQKWRRPASFGSLAAVDTLGIVLNDGLPSAGADYERLRFQYDGEFGSRWFLQAFVDHEVVDNGVAGERTSLFGFQVEQLAELRSTGEFFTPESDLEGKPVFDRGSLDTAGLAVNVLLSDRQSLALRYLWRDSDSQQADAGHDGWIPYVSRHYALLESQWQLPRRWLLGASATYRSERVEDDTSDLQGTADLDEVEAGWSFGLKAYWETVDKRQSVQAILRHLAPDEDAMVVETSDPYLKLQYSYRL